MGTMGTMGLARCTYAYHAVLVKETRLSVFQGGSAVHISIRRTILSDHPDKNLTLVLGC